MNYLAFIGFIFSLLAIGYTYFGYPVLVFLKKWLFPKQIIREKHEPTVTVLITAYNEESSMVAKLENTLSLDYPNEKLEILVASDGSTDNTDAIVGSFADRGVELFHQSGRVGKTHTQNEAIKKAKGEIIVFSDATTEYSKDVIRKLVPSFADNSVGCVAGKLIYQSADESAVGQGATTYWEYETLIKRFESEACSLIGVSGCMYAVRRSAYKPMYDEACSDFVISSVLYRQGLRSVFEPSATCFESTNEQSSKEIRMRVRVIAQTFNDLWCNVDILNPFKWGFFSIEMISHKLLRYLIPLWMTIILLSNVILASKSIFFSVFLMLQLLFYVVAIIGWALERNGVKLGLISIPFYFVLGAIATTLGFYRFLTGKRYVTWEPIRENNPASDTQS